MFQKPKGTEDFYPKEQAVKKKLFEIFGSLSEKYGFSQVETPSFETLDLLTKKSGDEIKKQIFLFKRRDTEEFGLRFDLTVPVTRMFLQKQKELPKPVKWFYTTRMWRYERPQAGRLREFYQMGVEMFGSKYPESDAEVINLAIDMLKSLGLTEKDFIVKLNNRKLLEGLLVKFIDEKKIPNIIRIIDKQAKINDEEFKKMLVEAGLKLNDITKLEKILAADTIDKIKELDMNAIASEGFDNLRDVYSLLDSKYVKLDLSTARGLAYYTGTVFEIFDSKEEFRSICGGGRYDNLVELFGGEPTPATGFAMGLSTLSLLLAKKDKLPKVSLSPDFYVAVVSSNIMGKAMKIVLKLREKYSVETDFLRRNLSKQISYADSIGAKKLIVIGEDEIRSGVVKLKDLSSGTETETKISEL